MGADSKADAGQLRAVAQKTRRRSSWVASARRALASQSALDERASVSVAAARASRTASLREGGLVPGGPRERVGDAVVDRRVRGVGEPRPGLLRVERGAEPRRLTIERPITSAAISSSFVPTWR